MGGVPTVTSVMNVVIIDFFAIDGTIVTGRLTVYLRSVDRDGH